MIINIVFVIAVAIFLLAIWSMVCIAGRSDKIMDEYMHTYVNGEKDACDDIPQCEEG